jgi:hypothetical protein
VSPKTKNGGSRHANGTVSPLELNLRGLDTKDSASNLSPVLETNTPSPKHSRHGKGDNADKENPGKRNSNSSKGGRNGNGQQKANGHVRGSKSEGSGTGSWQQIHKGKKGPNKDEQQKAKTSNNAQSQREEKPKNVAERKGG